MKNRKILGTLLAAAMIIAAFTGCSSNANSSSKAATVVTIGTQEMPNDEGIAKTEKYFESEMGVKVKLVSFSSGKSVNNALASNSIDLGLEGSCPAALAISNGIPVQVIWIHEVLGAVESLVVKNSANITSVANLKGKKVATPFASTSHYSLLNALKLNNVSDKDVKLLDMQPDDIYAAWQRGDIDAAYVWQPTLGKLLSDGGKILLTSGDMAKQGVITANVEVVRKSFGEKNPQLVTKYIKALEKAEDYFSQNKDHAVTTMSKALNISQSEALTEITGSTWPSGQEQISTAYLGTSKNKGKFAQTLKDTADFLVTQKSISSAPSESTFADAVNPSYVEDSLK